MTDRPDGPTVESSPPADGELDPPAGEQLDRQVDQPGDPGAEQPVAPAADPRVSGALRALDDLADLPLAEQVTAYEGVHRTLQEVLAEAAEGAPEAPASDRWAGHRHSGGAGS